MAAKFLFVLSIKAKIVVTITHYTSNTHVYLKLQVGLSAGTI